MMPVGGAIRPATLRRRYALPVVHVGRHARAAVVGQQNLEPPNARRHRERAAVRGAHSVRHGKAPRVIGLGLVPARALAEHVRLHALRCSRAVRDLDGDLGIQLAIVADGVTGQVAGVRNHVRVDGRGGPCQGPIVFSAHASIPVPM